MSSTDRGNEPRPPLYPPRDAVFMEFANVDGTMKTTSKAKPPVPVSIASSVASVATAPAFVLRPRPDEESESYLPSEGIALSEPAEPVVPKTGKAKKRARTADDIRNFLVEAVPRKHRKKGEWKTNFAFSTLCSETLATLFNEGIGKGKRRNFRTYIGPGSDGSGPDKVAIDFKFEAKNTKVTYKADWASYEKTVFTMVNDEWECVQKRSPLNQDLQFETPPAGCATIIHPPPDAHVAYVSHVGVDWSEFDFELRGGHFVPDVVYKAVTMSKANKRTVTAGERLIRKQDDRYAVFTDESRISQPRKETVACDHGQCRGLHPSNWLFL